MAHFDLDTYNLDKREQYKRINGMRTNKRQLYLSLVVTSKCNDILMSTDDTFLLSLLSNNLK